MRQGIWGKVGHLGGNIPVFWLVGRDFGAIRERAKLIKFPASDLVYPINGATFLYGTIHEYFEPHSL